MTIRPACSTLHPATRREFLARAGGGLGALALTSLLNERADAAPKFTNPLAPRPAHFAARAKRVIWCFLDGGPSHIDLFDPKPELTRLAGSPLPASFKRPVTSMGTTAGTPLMASTRKFAQHGQCGHWVSDLYPEVATCADELCLLQSCTADGLNHVAAVSQINTGSLLPGHPSLGSWSLYGLGTENQDLPGFVVMGDKQDDPPGGTSNWGTGFMPASYQGTRLGQGKQPILDISPASGVSAARQRGELDFLQELNRNYARRRPGDNVLEARIAS